MQQLSVYQYVLDRLRETKGTWPKVAEGSGVPYRTLEKIARRERKSPGVLHIERLARYFTERTAASP